MVALLVTVIMVGIFAGSFDFAQYTDQQQAAAPLVPFSQLSSIGTGEQVRLNGTVMGSFGALIDTCDPPVGEYENYWSCYSTTFNVVQDHVIVTVDTGYLGNFVDWYRYTGGNAVILGGDSIALVGHMESPSEFSAVTVGETPTQFGPPAWQGELAIGLTTATVVLVVAGIAAHYFHRYRVKAHSQAQWKPGEFAPDLKIEAPPIT